jgi:hypothetical protein
MRRSASTTIRRRHREQPASHLLTTDTYATIDTADDIADSVAARHATFRLYQAIDDLADRERRLIQLLLDPAESGYACISPHITHPDRKHRTGPRTRPSTAPNPPPRPRMTTPRPTAHPNHAIGAADL